MKNQLKRMSLLVLSAFALYSCGPEEPTLENDEELITTLELSFRNQDSGEETIFKFYDEDGFGSAEPVYTNGELLANSNYVVEVSVLNETETPAEDITVEVKEEAESHQFFFDIENSLDMDFSYDDTDVNNNPIGLRNTFTTRSASQGTLTVVLRHEPDKTAEGVKDGDITNAGGETDVQAVFNVTVN